MMHLDDKRCAVHKCAMRNILSILMVLSSVASLPAQTTAPLEVVNSSITAVNDLGKEVVLGKYKTALDRMYPPWKSRLARRLGGEEKMTQQFEQLKAEMLKQGTSMVSFKSYGFPKVFECYPGKKVEIVDGKEVEVLISTKWLILIPTETRYRIMNGNEFMVIESKGFQVAISDKDKIEWSFIDGAGLVVQDLRSLFISLPQDMVLPETVRREVPKSEQ
jgi:hypothetical protein